MNETRDAVCVCLQNYIGQFCEGTYPEINDANDTNFKDAL